MRDLLLSDEYILIEYILSSAIVLTYAILWIHNKEMTMILALLFIGYDAEAVPAPLTQEELAEMADLAIVGEVVTSQCDSIAETEQSIVRTYTAEVAGLWRIQCQCGYGKMH